MALLRISRTLTPRSEAALTAPASFAGDAGKSLEAAVYAMEELEETAKLHLLLQAHKPRCLTEPQIEELRRVFKLP